MKPETRRAFNAAMFAPTPADATLDSEHEKAFIAGMMEAARLCRNRAADHDSRARSTFRDPRMHVICRDEVVALADAIESSVKGE